MTGSLCALTSWVRTPRIAGKESEPCCPQVSPGDRSCRRLTSVIRARARSAAPIAVTDNGTSCNRSVRRCAVTTMSPSAPVDALSDAALAGAAAGDCSADPAGASIGAVCAAAGVASATARTAKEMPLAARLVMLFPFCARRVVLRRLHKGYCCIRMLSTKICIRMQTSVVGQRRADRPGTNAPTNERRSAGSDGSSMRSISICTAASVIRRTGCRIEVT